MESTSLLTSLSCGRLLRPDEKEEESLVQLRQMPYEGEMKALVCAVPDG